MYLHVNYNICTYICDVHSIYGVQGTQVKCAVNTSLMINYIYADTSRLNSGIRLHPPDLSSDLP